MKGIADTGFLVAFANAHDRHHQWAVSVAEQISAPLLTCEAVLSEASFLVARVGGDPAVIPELVARGVLEVAAGIAGDARGVARLIRRYASVPMSFADACLVHLVERTANAALFTLDQDFQIYRQKGRRLIPLLAPWQGR